MMRWPFIVLSWNIWLSQLALGVPVPQLQYSQLPQMPSSIQYIGLSPLPGGTQQSLLTANFAPNQIVTSSGMATNPLDTGLPASIDFIGSGIVDAGKGIGSAFSSLLSSKFPPFELKPSSDTFLPKQKQITNHFRGRSWSQFVS